MANKKWKVSGLSSGNADAESRSATPIYDGPLPPVGPYRGVLKRLKVGEVQSGKNEGSPKISCVFNVHEEPGAAKARYNGSDAWMHLPVVDSQAGSINQLLDALTDGKSASVARKVKEAFWSGNVMHDEDDMITKIGSFVVPPEVRCGANLTVKKASGGYEEGRNVGDLFPFSQAPESKAADEEDEEPDEDEDDESNTEEDDEIAERQEELEAMSVKERRSIGNKLGIEKTVKGADLIEAILDAEFPEDDEDDDDDEEEEEEPDDEDEDDEDEEGDEEEPDRDELAKLSLAKLRTAAKSEYGHSAADVKGLDKDGLLDLICGEEPEEDDEDEDEDEDEEPEEEPAKPARRSRAAAKASSAAPARRRGKRSKGDEPPF